MTHWTGSPIALAVARNAELEAGSNPAARMARGLKNMTLRDAAMSPPPDEDWVDLRYSGNGSIFETRIPWRVFDSIDDFKKAISGGGGTALACYSATDTFAAGFQDHEIGKSSRTSWPTGPTARSSRCPRGPSSAWRCGVRCGSGSAGAGRRSRISAS
ncbi:MAG TPA: hypothetical protein VFX25_30030, partial [Streptosporangiaceae bacterium]|nr:hypothetical protein [Streptosporangiaceae bacterium]